MSGQNPKDPIAQETLTPAEFYGLLRRLDANPERAADEYERIRRKLVKFFEWSSCLAAEDLADITLNRVARKVGTDAIQDVEAFAWGVAKKLRQEAQKRDRKTISLQALPTGVTVSDGGGAIEDLHQKIQREKELRCLHKCLQHLSPEDYLLFLAYRVDKGQYVKNRKNLAKQLELTPGALRVRVIRIREK